MKKVNYLVSLFSSFEGVLSLSQDLALFAEQQAFFASPFIAQEDFESFVASFLYALHSFVSCLQSFLSHFLSSPFTSLEELDFTIVVVAKLDVEMKPINAN